MGCVKADDTDIKTLNVPLTHEDRLRLMYYIEEEKIDPEFFKGKEQIMIETFLYFFYSGHACSDNKSKIVLNEKELDKTLWPAEDRIR